MSPREINKILRKGFTKDLDWLETFQKRYFLMRYIKSNFKDAPEYLIYFMINHIREYYDYKNNRDLFIDAFMDRILPILSQKKKEK